MWRLIDCGTYLWFVLEKQKYFHCVYAYNGEYKKIKIDNRVKPKLYAMNDKMYLAYLKTWPLNTASCILDKKSAKFYIKHWKDKTKTKLMKEIIKQLKAAINGKGTN